MTINESLDSVGDSLASLRYIFDIFGRLGGGATPRDMYLENYVYVRRQFGAINTSILIHN